MNGGLSITFVKEKIWINRCAFFGPILGIFIVSCSHFTERTVLYHPLDAVPIQNTTEERYKISNDLGEVLIGWSGEGMWVSEINEELSRLYAVYCYEKQLSELCCCSSSLRVQNLGCIRWKWHGTALNWRVVTFMCKSI